MLGWKIAATKESRRVSHPDPTLDKAEVHGDSVLLPVEQYKKNIKHAATMKSLRPEEFPAASTVPPKL